MLRKRAWDIMRDDFATLNEGADLAQAMQKLSEAIKLRPEQTLVVVVSETGQFRGVVTAWDVLHAVEKYVFQGESLRNLEDADWDKAFVKACTKCQSIPVNEIMHKDVPLAKPNDPLLVVLSELAAAKRNWGVVEEGGRPIGIILVGDLYTEVTRDMLGQV